MHGILLASSDPCAFSVELPAEGGPGQSTLQIHRSAAAIVISGLVVFFVVPVIAKSLIDLRFKRLF